MNQSKNSKNRLVVADLGWAETIPEWILKEIEFERMAYGLGALINPNGPKVGDAEVVAYLYTASLRAAMPHEYYEIYLHLVAALFKRKGTKLPANIEYKEELDSEEKRVLEGLREEIYQKRGGEIDHPLLNAMRALNDSIVGKLKGGEN